MNWDTSVLCKDEKALQKLMKKAEEESLKFETDYKGKLDKLNEAGFLKAVKSFETILEDLGRAMTYVFLEFAADTTKGGFYAKYNERSTQIHEKLLFFELEFNKLPKKSRERFIKKAKNYAYYLKQLEESKKHQLSFKEERILLKKSPVSVHAFSRLFDEHLSRMKFKMGNQVLSEEEVLSRLYDTKRETRKKAAETLTKGLEPHVDLLAYIFNMVRTDTKISCEIRGYKSPEEPRHKDNQISQKSVDALVKTAEENTELVSRYYKLKGKLLGLNTLYDYDRYAPVGKSEQKFDFEESKKMVLESFEAFHPEFFRIAKMAFDEKWVDVYPRDNKRGGAFSHGAVPSAHPFVLLNHTDRRRDVFTLAHELGHAIHQYLSREVGYLNADTPLTTAETASVFAEMLLFERFKEKLEGEELINLYAGKLEDIFATLYRQIIFTTYERRVHANPDEMKPEEFSKIWMEENQKMFGNSVNLTKNYQIWWSYIPHFIHSPFYCYAYSYGQLLVLALYSLYQQGFDGFEDRYIKFLSSGGSKPPKELIEMFGFNIENKKFWNVGLDQVKVMLDSFEGLVHGR